MRGCVKSEGLGSLSPFPTLITHHLAPTLPLPPHITQVDIEVELGGSDSQRLFAFNMRLTHQAGKVW